MNHRGHYAVLIEGGPRVLLPLSVEYRWVPHRAETRWEPAEGGPEIESVSVEVDGDLYPLEDWSQALHGEIAENIRQQHRSAA